MKINKQIFNQVTSTPFEVQELDGGVKVEMHSLNENEGLFKTYVPQSKFAIWSCVDGKTYRLLLENGYYEVMRDFYMTRVNQEWINFWNKVEKDRSKLMKFVYFPVVVVLFILIFVFMYLPTWTNGFVSSGVSTGILVGCLVAFLIFTMFLNKKIDKIISKHNNDALENIKQIIGHKHFDELIDAQRAYYDTFFAKVNEEANEGAEPTEEAKTEENQVEEASEAEKNE